MADFGQNGDLIAYFWFIGTKGVLFKTFCDAIPYDNIHWPSSVFDSQKTESDRLLMTCDIGLKLLSWSETTKMVSRIRKWFRRTLNVTGLESTIG